MTILVPIEAARDRNQYGGKAANLAFLASLGLNVPAARVLPADEFKRQVAVCGSGELAAELRARALRPELVSELRELVSTLGGRVSVRSSATLEDARTHSFAGQFSTILNVGVDGIEAAVRSVWASVYSEHVGAYLRRADLDPANLRMAVVIQRQVDSEASGVAMGRPGGVVVEAVFGQGEALVSGAVSADHWEVERGRVASTRIATKAKRIGIAEGAPTGELVPIELTQQQRAQPSLNDAQVLEVAAACARIAEASEGRPQDCEFAFAAGRLHLLQTRDVTASLPVTAPALQPFAPPGKGPWELDTNHFLRPCTPMFQTLFPPAMMAGFKRSLERYGAVLSHLDFAFVNGFPYTRLRPLAAPEDAAGKPPPPAWVFKLLCKLAPPLRRRMKAADRVLATREWRTQLQEWQVAKARAVEQHLALQAVALDALDDAALARHFEVVRDHVSKMIEQHHTYNIATLLPTGDLLCHVASWSGGKIADAEVLALLTGASPIAADLASEDARKTGAALADDAQASALLRLKAPEGAISDRAAEEALTSLRARPGDLGEQVRRFLAMREYRLVEGLDPGAPCLHEHPSLLWQALRSAALAAKSPPASSTQQATVLARIRDAVPESKHAELDALIADARALASLRDERALYSDVWAWGILRTTVLAIGRRLMRRSPALLCDAADLVHATPDEVLSLLRHSKGPSALELETRAAHRRAYTMRDAPSTLGPKALPPPSPELLPPGAGRVHAAIMRIMVHVLPPPAERSADGMRGNAASSGVFEGPAHIVNGHDDAKNIPAGAVLVVGSSSSTFTMLAPLASAVVAEGGGLLCHVAIVCREYRIPCVCGVAGVLESVKGGQRLRVDGTRGVVDVIAV
jgi:phosphohistidine swiveling domain-containing protein